MSDIVFDAVIVGAGPIGIELAVAFKKAGIHYLHLDARQIGYTISWFAPQTKFFSSNERIAIAGVPLVSPDQTKSTREQYLAYLRGVVQQFDLRINTYEPVIDIHRDADAFVIRTQKPATTTAPVYRARRLILATGGTERPRRLNIAGEDLPHVSHYFQDPHLYFRRRLLVIGGRNSAVEAALRSHHAGAHVTISYRRPKLDAASIKYWLAPEINGLMETGAATGYFNTRPVQISPSRVTLAGPDGAAFDVPTDFVLALIGYEADMTLCRMAGVALQDPGQIPQYDPNTMETNVKGVFVAGTAVGGTQEKYGVFIENCHVHVDRILASLTGQKAPEAIPEFDRPES